MKAVGYIPVANTEFKEQETERIWALVTGSGQKIAIGFVYMCSTSAPDHVAYNEKLYRLLQNDVEELRGEGYVILMMGDFNGHLGQRSLGNPHGILGDTCGRNQNGTL